MKCANLSELCCNLFWTIFEYLAFVIKKKVQKDSVQKLESICRHEKWGEGQIELKFICTANY
jgi:hypothetical protein